MGAGLLPVTAKASCWQKQMSQGALFRYVSEWADLIDFEIEPVVTDDEAASVLKDMT